MPLVGRSVPAACVRPPLQAPRSVLGCLQRRHCHIFGPDSVCCQPFQNLPDGQCKHCLNIFEFKLPPQPTGFNNMDHEKMFKATCLLIITDTATFLSVKGILFHRILTASSIPVIMNPSTFHWRHRAFLIDQDNWEVLEVPPLLLQGVLLVVVTISLSLLVVRCRTATQQVTITSSGKFRNPLKNLNLVILVIICSYSIFQLLCHRYSLLPSLLFSHFPLGLIPTTMLLAFLLGNPAARSFAAKRTRSLLASPASLVSSQFSTLLPPQQHKTIRSSTIEKQANQSTTLDPINDDTEKLDFQKGNQRSGKNTIEMRRGVDSELVLEDI